jgi:hypothetical protein
LAAWLFRLIDISLETANKLYTAGWTLSLAGAVVTLLGVGMLWWGTRVRDKDFDHNIAMLHDRAAKSELEVARLTTPRVRLLTPEAVNSLVEKIKPFAGTKFDIGLPPIGREQWDLLWQLEPIFPQAGWVFVDWVPTPGTKIVRKMNWQMQYHLYGEANVINLDIELHPPHRETLLPAANALADALNQIGITTTIQPVVISGSSQNVDAIHILVGQK